MSQTITEPARTISVSASYDVVVVGGGIGGVAAAIAAARNGARTALLERGFGLGGLATLGNIVIYEPLDDGLGHQVMGGLAEELLLRSIHDIRVRDNRILFRPVPECWRPGHGPVTRQDPRYEVAFNPFSFQIEMEAMMREEGIELWYDTRFCACVRDRARITHVVVENKEGRSAIACGAVIDASGDADVCAAAGEATVNLDTNVLAGWYYELEDGALRIQTMSNEFSDRGVREGSEEPLLSGIDARHVTRHVVETRAMIRKRIHAHRAKKPAAEIHPFALSSIPDFRMTRRLSSSFTLSEHHQHTWFDDAIGMTSDWRHRGPVYCLPYRCIRAESNRNLFAVGRCISSEGRAWDMSRVINTCAVTGEAAGTAAAMALQQSGGDVHALPINALQERLRERKGILDPRLIGTRAAWVHK